MAITDQLTRVFLGTEDPLTAEDATWIAANSGAVLFGRAFTDTQRAEYDGGSTQLGQYTNFTTMLKTEYTSWVATYGASQIDAYLATDSLGQTYGHINGGTEYLCDFSNTDWLDFRLARTPGWDAVGKLGSTNLDTISMDLCPLYPTSNLVGTQGNPYADVDTWKTNMIAAVTYVRARIDSGIAILCNGLREFLSEPGFQQNPAAFEDYDGTDLVNPGTIADGVNIEAGIDYDSAGFEWLYSLRAIYRCSNASKIAVAAFSTDTAAEPQSDAEVQRRVNNLVSYALVHKPSYTLFVDRSSNSFSPYPVQTFPEMGVQLGTPVEAVNANFTSYDTPTQGLITRTFTGGDAAYAVVFNYSAADIAMPSTYLTGYEQIRPNGYTEVTNGTTQAAMVTAAVPATVGPGEGFIMQPQSGTLTVTTDSLTQLTGACTVHFGVGPTGMMLDTGEFTVGQDRSEVLPSLDLQDGDDWEVAVAGKDQPGDRSDRTSLEYTAMSSGAQEIGTGGQGRWVRVVVRARTPRLHRIGAAEMNINFHDDR